MIAANPAVPWEHRHGECVFCEKQAERLRALEAELATWRQYRVNAEYDIGQLVKEHDALKARVAELIHLEIVCPKCNFIVRVKNTLVGGGRESDKGREASRELLSREETADRIARDDLRVAKNSIAANPAARKEAKS